MDSKIIPTELTYTLGLKDEHIKSIHDLIFYRSCYISYWPGERESGLEFLKTINSLEKIETWVNDFIVLALDGPDFIGFVRGKKTGRISHLYVDIPFQKQGIGTELVSYMETLFIENKINSCFTNSDLRYINFYKERGYKELGSKFNYNGLHVLRMQKELF